MGESSIHIDKKTDGAGRVESLTLELEKTEDKRISRRLSMSARGRWSSTPVLDGCDVRESLTFQTLVKSPRTWWEHLDMHVGVLDLVSLAAWKNCAFREIHVNRHDDPVKVPTREISYERWSEILSHRLPGDDLTD